MSDVPLYFAATTIEGRWAVYLSRPEEKVVKRCVSKEDAVNLARAMNADVEDASIEELEAAAHLFRRAK